MPNNPSSGLSLTSPPTPSAIWWPIRRPSKPRDRSGARLRHKSGEVDTRSVEAILKAAKELGLTIVWALETHAHADHLSGAPTSRRRPGQRSASASTSRTCSASSGRSSTRPI